MDSNGQAVDLSLEQRELSTGGPWLRSIVAIGSSAGGLADLEEFFKNIPAPTDAAFVVIQHLSPDYRSFLDQLLQRHTDLVVCPITDGIVVEPGRVYVLPPNKEAILCQGKLLLTDRSRERSVIYPVDDFLRSVANEAGNKAIAVIFSGTGSDGSRGVRDIHAAGGFVIAQSPETASFSGMPKNAIASGVVDLVLSPREAAKAILRKIDRNQQEEQEAPSVALGEYGSIDPSLDDALRVLRVKSGIEYTDYLPSVIFDSIEKRTAQLGLQSVHQYVATLLQDPGEARHLLAAIVQGEPTGFFCDDETYDRLASDVVPTLMSSSSEDQDFRAWVIGSGTGEEVYTLAILLSEWYEQKGLPQRVKIFASDTHSDSLSIASRAIYRADALWAMTPDRIEKYFIERPDGFHVVPELRKMVVFTPHNCLREAPFTRMDMVCCRHLMRRLSAGAQSKAMSLIHFALRDGGALLLEPEFQLGEMSQEFETVSLEHGIFLKHRLVNTRRRNMLTGSGREAIACRTLPDMRTSQRELMELYDRMLEMHVPAAWLVSEDGTLLHTFQDAGKYMEARGRAKTDIVSLVKEELRGPLMLLMRHVTESRLPLDIHHVSLDGPEGEALSLRAEPLVTRSGRTGIIIKVIKPAPSPVDSLASAPAATLDLNYSRSHSRADLERELELTRENLQLTIQDLRIANEELKEINEEVTCANEELQSANEELHSVNEELHTVNAEHQRKIDELTALNDDMDNLLTNSNVHTLFLSRDLRLRLFTPRIVDLFNLIPQDIGRHIATFNHNLMDVSLAAEAEKVLQDDRTLRREVQSYEGHWFVLRISPYLSRGNVEGVVITLVDITSQKNAQEEVKAAVRLRDRFLAMLSHELRNPLAAVLSAIQLVDESSDQQERAMQVIRRQSQQMARLLDDLLDVSRISNNKFELIKQSVDFSDIIDSAMQALEPMAQERGLNLAFHGPNQPVNAIGDPQRLEQVMVNLLNNAIKYSIPGGTIEVELNTEDDQVHISVRDSGVGLTAEMKGRVFDLFVQSEATLDRANGGMGVGLTLVKTIVEMHGGDVRVESNGLNRGCQFLVRLPYERSQATSLPRTDDLPSQPMKVVIVEDMDDSREMLAELLTLKGHQVQVASEGDSGLDLIKQVEPDVALVDIGLPKLDGFEIARAIRTSAKYDRIKLVALTGYGQYTDRQAVQSAGFDEHIVKPLKPKELLQVISPRTKSVAPSVP